MGLPSFTNLCHDTWHENVPDTFPVPRSAGRPEANMTVKLGDRHNRAVLRVLQHYGVAIEAYGRACEGSPVGAANMKRLAEDAARNALYCLLGRAPTGDELNQIPPFFEPPVVSAPTDQVTEPTND